MIKRISLIATLLGAGMVSMAFILADKYWIAGLILISFIIITFIASKRMAWIDSPSLFLIVGFAVVGLFLDMEPVLLYSGVICSLAGWDLADFSARIHLGGQENSLDELQKSHLVRLGKVLAVGICIMVVASTINLTPAFGWVSVLAILSTIGLGRLVSQLLKDG